MHAGTLNGGSGLSRSTTTRMPAAPSFSKVERVPERTSSTGIKFDVSMSLRTIAPL